jgi:hypothetical protein
VESWALRGEKWLALALALASCESCTSPKLMRAPDPLCGTPCYGGHSSRAGVGECAFGHWACDQEGRLLECEGWVAPGHPECNGLDNDCDGEVDGETGECRTACGLGTRRCQRGVWGSCSAPAPRPESCNGLDDDCDGEFDEAEELPVGACYSGPPATLRHGECRFGLTRCIGGANVCVGEILPVPEACNGKDDNCDGKADEGMGTRIYDFVLVLDESGSMDDLLWAVKRAVAGWSGKYARRPEMRFALVLAPGGAQGDDQRVRLANDFVDAGAFAVLIQAQGAGNTALEPTLDALLDIADVPANPLALSWRSDSTKAAILFTDELAQTYRTPVTRDVDVAAAAKTSGVQLVVFTHLEWFASYAQTGATLVDAQRTSIGGELDRIFSTITCQ